jgi:hypothetical protein
MIIDPMINHKGGQHDPVTPVSRLAAEGGLRVLHGEEKVKKYILFPKFHL